MGENFNGLAAKIRNRFQEQKNPALVDPDRVALPWGSLTKKEFSIAISQNWVEKREKAYFLTRTFVDLVKSLPQSAMEDPETDAEAGAGTERDRFSESSGAGRRARDDRDSWDQPPAKSAPSKKLATEPKGPFQIKVLEIIYRGVNKLGYPSLLVMGSTERGDIKKIQRGIPQDIATQLCQHPDKFTGKVFAIDEKDNFIGVVLGQVDQSSDAPKVPPVKDESAAEPAKPSGPEPARDSAPAVNPDIQEPPRSEVDEQECMDMLR